MTEGVLHAKRPPRKRLFFFRLCDSDSYCSFAYSALAAMKIGMSGSASFQIVRKSRGHYSPLHLLAGRVPFWRIRIQYSTSFSPFSEIIFWNCATILSRRAITAFTSSLLR